MNSSELLAATTQQGSGAQEQAAAAGLLPSWVGDEELHLSHRSSRRRHECPLWWMREVDGKCPPQRVYQIAGAHGPANGLDFVLDAAAAARATPISTMTAT